MLGNGKAPFVVLLVANAASYAVAGALVLRLPAIRPPDGEPGEKSGYREVVRDGLYIRVALLNVVVALHDNVLLLGMPLRVLPPSAAPPGPP